MCDFLTVRSVSTRGGGPCLLVPIFDLVIFFVTQYFDYFHDIPHSVHTQAVCSKLINIQFDLPPPLNVCDGGVGFDFHWAAILDKCTERARNRLVIVYQLIYFLALLIYVLYAAAYMFAVNKKKLYINSEQRRHLLNLHFWRL